MSGINLAFNIGGANRQENISGVAPEILAAIVRQHDERSQEQKKLIARLEKDLDLNHGQMRAALDIVGEANVPLEGMSSKRIEVAQRFRALQEQIGSAQPGDDSQIAALKADAQAAVDSGDLVKADALLAQIETRQRQALDRLAVNAAETSRKRGDIAETRLQYREAARHFANAAAVLPLGGVNEEKRIAYLEKEADALYRQGDEFGDNDALAAAIDRRKQFLGACPSNRVFDGNIQ